MSPAIHLVTVIEDEQVNTDYNPSDGKTECWSWQGQAGWTTKQLIGACLWSALFGVGCGYAWLFFQISRVAG